MENTSIDVKKIIEIFKKSENGVIREVHDKQYMLLNFSVDQIDELYIAYLMGHREEEFSIYANPKLNWKEMRNIILSLNAGLTLEQINQYRELGYKNIEISLVNVIDVDALDLFLELRGKAE